MSRLTREELVEKVADALSGSTIWGDAAAIGSDDSWPLAARAVDAVLAALADERDAVADEYAEAAHRSRTVGLNALRLGECFREREAADRLRSLMGGQS